MDCFSWDSGRNIPDRVCKDCRAAYQRAHARKPSAIRARRARQLRKVYGIEPDDYLTLYAEQDGRCRICREPIANLLEDLDVDMRGGSGVDHCHASNKVRGLLCVGCNTGLGAFGDDVGRLRSAIEYLTR